MHLDQANQDDTMASLEAASHQGPARDVEWNFAALPMTLAACALAAVVGVALATPSVTGPDYTEPQIRSKIVAGIHLGMTEDAATAALRAQSYTEDVERTRAEGRNAPVWAAPDRTVTLSRFLALDGRIHVSGMSAEWRFDRPQLVQSLRDTVVKEYGGPTEAQVGGDRGELVYHVPYTVGRWASALCVVHWTALCPDADRAALDREDAAPRLTVTFDAMRLRAVLSDGPGAAGSGMASAIAVGTPVGLGRP